ncbi:MAG: hypothetical protein V3U96_08930 [Paracoccaceae bacterium]
MKKSFKAFVTATALGAVAIAPLAIAATVISADAAFAKGNKSNMGNKGAKEKRTGPKANRGNSNRSQGAKANGSGKQVARLSTPATEALHSSQLGNLNGAIHSSPNAKLAHIRNGNFNGPVGLAAALAVADHNGAEVDQVVQDAALATLALDQAIADLNTAAMDAGYDSYEHYLTENDAGSLMAELETLITDTELPSPEQVADATAAIEAAAETAAAIADAEAALLAAWNKGDATDPDAALALDQIRGSLPSPEDIAAALAETQEETDMLPEDEEALLEPDLGDEMPEEPIEVASQ